MMLFDVVERSTGKVVHSTDKKEDAKIMRDGLSRQAAPKVFQAHEDARINLNSYMESLEISHSDDKASQDTLKSLHHEMIQPLPYFVRKGADHWKLWPKKSRVSYIKGMATDEAAFLGSAR